MISQFLYCILRSYESEFIEKIVRDTSAKLTPMPLQINHLVGLDSRFEQVKSLIDIDSDDTVSMLGIYDSDQMKALKVWKISKGHFCMRWARNQKSCWEAHLEEVLK